MVIFPFSKKWRRLKGTKQRRQRSLRSPNASLVDLPVDLQNAIFTHLLETNSRSASALSRTCRQLHAVFEKHTMWTLMAQSQGVVANLVDRIDAPKDRKRWSYSELHLQLDTRPCFCCLKGQSCEGMRLGPSWPRIPLCDACQAEARTRVLDMLKRVRYQDLLDLLDLHRNQLPAISFWFLCLFVLFWFRFGWSRICWRSGSGRFRRFQRRRRRFVAALLFLSVKMNKVRKS